MSHCKMGVDVGRLFLKLVYSTPEASAPSITYLPHHGHPQQLMLRKLSEMDGKPLSLGISGNNAALLTDALDIEPIHPVRAKITAVREVFPQARNILAVGAGSSALILLDENGDFLNYSSNSLCAAGTGSFLDEQARRLGIDFSEMQDIEFDENPPSIASRCAVFAKSDLIHRQQEGHGKQAMWAGLCKGCVDTFLQTLLKGKPLSGQTVVVGGIAKNQLILKWLHRYYRDQIVTWPNAHLAGALGAMRLANTSTDAKSLRDNLQRFETIEVGPHIGRGEPLELVKTDYPSFAVLQEQIDELGNEIFIRREIFGKTIDTFLGIDIGSTSTKLALIDQDRQVLFDIYRKTGGNPLSAVKRLFTAVEDICAANDCRLNVLGCGTTGSGRKFIGRIVGADRIVNEISAHIAGAMEIDPRIETIFEIGGQDAKYMHTRNGAVCDANMNYICAAGTGSFVEEQANKLGFRVEEIGDLVMGVCPPETSDRCTVFMEEDVARLLRQGYSKVDAIAAVMNSVVKNYLSKVVGNRHFSRDRIFFQGATARNKGLVAAFEKQLGVEMVVSPLCHQMGAFGVAVLTGRAHKKNAFPSAFRGFDLARRSVELTAETCDACNNRCKITFAEIEGSEQRPSWGYMCGKEPGETTRKATAHFALFRKRDKFLRDAYRNQSLSENAPVAALPAALTTHSYLPFWVAFFNSLGWRVVTSPASDEEIKQRGIQASPGDFCYPIKLAIGHALAITEQTQAEVHLLPQMISAPANGFATSTYFCPYVQSFPAVVRSIVRLNGIAENKLVTPVVDFTKSDAAIARDLHQAMTGKRGVTFESVKKALAQAKTAQNRFDEQCRQEGREALRRLQDTGEKAIVILGRPYNCFDPGANIHLPEKISDYGYTVVPIDFIPFEAATLGEQFRNVYWHFGQRIVSASRFVAARENLFPVYLSNFSCGPDSFLQTYVERIMGDKPLLILELDEHGADAGYMTRVEAFLEVVAGHAHQEPKPLFSIPPVHTVDLKRRTLWLPPMHPYAVRLAAAAFRRYGYNARALPPEDRDAFELGRKAVRGNECLPTHLTTGALLQQLHKEQASPEDHAFFMATACGPCRFGQYATLQRTILDDNGYAGMPIVSPSSINSYQGLEEPVRRLLWHAMLASDVLYKMRCKVRPYEKQAGDTEAVVEKHLLALERFFENGGDMPTTIRRAAHDFSAVPRFAEKKPLVGVVGEIYVRCNPTANDRVIESIEQYGGEAWLAPLSEWFLYTAYTRAWRARQNLWDLLHQSIGLLKDQYLFHTEHRIYRWSGALLNDRHEPPISQVVAAGAKYLPIDFLGEAIITLGRARKFLENGAAMVVNAAPFGCMPGTLTAGIFQEMQQELEAPVVNMYYDGTGDINRQLEVYLRELRT